MSESDIGLIGVGAMGAMLSLNIAEHGYRVSIYDKDREMVRRVCRDAGELSSRIDPHEDLVAFLGSLRRPRSLVLMVPAGNAVDDVIAAILPHISDGDLFVDAGNANFGDTRKRAQTAQQNGYLFLGVGVSGGVSGARFGPAIMAGGDAVAWERVAPILTAIAARYEDQPCAAWVGPDGAGHFVKTVHNGIEYADMQLIAEVYGMLRDGLDMSAQDVSKIFARWNEGPLSSYLIGATADVSGALDPDTGSPMLDVILDKAGQKGTGRWTLIEAQRLGVPATVVEAAVAARFLSADTDLRAQGAQRFPNPDQCLERSSASDIDALEQALTAAKVICYAQGFDLLAKASSEYDWNLSLPVIARLWREGCIIRSSMLNEMAAALDDSPGANLMLSQSFAGQVERGIGPLRRVVGQAIAHGIPVPALSAAVAYFDLMRSSRTTANLIQGQRDYFGQHGFERTDQPGTGFHGPWKTV